MIYRNSYFILTALLLTCAGACFDPQEGCLDIAATNFYPAADRDCCCRYPNLILRSNQVYDNLLFRQDSLYPGANGHLFRIKNIVFYLSEFTLTKEGRPYPVNDSIELKYLNNATTDTLVRYFTDDFTLVRRAPLDNTVAAFREDGTFNQIRFRLGLSETANRILPAQAPRTHPLYLQNEQLHQNGFVFLQAVVVRNADPATPPDTLNFFRSDLPDQWITADGDFVHEIGTDFLLTLHADWAKMFEGVIWTNYDIPAWKSRIVANLPSVFTVTP